MEEHPREHAKATKGIGINPAFPKIQNEFESLIEKEWKCFSDGMLPKNHGQPDNVVLAMRCSFQGGMIAAMQVLFKKLKMRSDGQITTEELNRFIQGFYENAKLPPL